MPQKWKYVNELRLSLVSLLIVGLISISLGVWNLFPSEGKGIILIPDILES